MSLRSVLDASRASRIGGPVYIVAGRYDRRVIMQEAVRIARSLRAGGASWSWRMRMGLTAAWRQARKAKAEAALVAARPAAQVFFGKDAHAVGTPRVRVFTSGARSFSHGW